ncbi:MAG: Ribosomal RNA small subunit methyltransferase E [Candidatus Nomurabacteria bacterium GW2011_GWA2_40_9]|uniref:Ribosomal RNA small subunit methyltransferase E n=1 Tax=Candidatus Nomurabacteria bacterium GW2011_GWA2_40_9 TaxID=1618734 RepID=A0A0G0WVA2_9BACT|nr:MAG: Ribosomal RNA small subunit methyltransferase E [Candidatus Nomurabacteria bacterium GW2011_GWA2_40_9]
MRLNRFIGDFDLSKNEIIITNSENIKQIRGVLRLEIGDHIILLDGKGRETEVEIVSILKEVIQTKLVKEIKINEPERKVHLYLAILKKENFELAVQKAVECGVSEITPVITERTIKTGLNTERLEKIIKEACEQCGQNVTPFLYPIMNFKEAILFGKMSEEKIIFDLVKEAYMPDKNAKNISIFIGPEGGFTEKEIKLAQDSGFVFLHAQNLNLLFLKRMK